MSIQQKAFNDELQKQAAVSSILAAVGRVPILGAALRRMSPEMRRLKTAHDVWRTTRSGHFSDFLNKAQPALDRIDLTNSNKAMRILNSKGNILSTGQKVGLGLGAGAAALYLTSSSPSESDPQIQQYSALQQPYV